MRLYLYVMLRLNQAFAARSRIWSAGFEARAKKFSERLDRLDHG